MKERKIIAAALIMMSIAGTALAQQPGLTGQTKNFISTGMPIMLIAPDAVSGAMGDVGAATRPDAFSAHWNNAKLAFVDNSLSVGTTYTPWLRNLKVYDMNLL